MVETNSKAVQWLEEADWSERCRHKINAYNAHGPSSKGDTWNSNKFYSIKEEGLSLDLYDGRVSTQCLSGSEFGDNEWVADIFVYCGMLVQCWDNIFFQLDIYENRPWVGDWRLRHEWSTMEA